MLMGPNAQQTTSNELAAVPPDQPVSNDQRLHPFEPRCSSSSPRILISAGPTGASNYEHALLAAGGHPVSVYCPPADVSFDGLLLTGGGDIDPARYGHPFCGSMPPDPARDEAELNLVRAYLTAGKPILGICRGYQILNVALGGTMIQDLGPDGNLFHRREDADKVHPICAEAGSVLHQLYGTVFSVNSAHHQAVDVPGNAVQITAHSEGGVAEALELPGRPVLGVQFHPERMTGALRRPDTVDGSHLFRWFVDCCLQTL